MKPKRKTADRGQMQCQECGVEVVRRSALQRYCAECSAKRDVQRKKLDHLRRGKVRYENTRTKYGAKGKALNAGHRLTIETSKPFMPDMAWYRRIEVPFSWAGSKNHIFTKRADGHVFLREESRFMRFNITERVQEALADVTVVQNKLWLDIFVQKPTARGDAVNFVDLVCDAVKDGMVLDDKWFCLRSVDWQIVKEDPMLFIGLGQETTENVQACSSCGRLLSFEKFQRHRGRANGIGLNCRECQAVRENSKKRLLSELDLASELKIGIFG